MRLVLWLSAVLLVATPAHATFAIAAIDPGTGDFGVAVASAAVAIGARVADGEAGVGIIATIGNPTYKRRGLELLRSGSRPSRSSTSCWRKIPSRTATIVRWSSSI